MNASLAFSSKQLVENQSDGLVRSLYFEKLYISRIEFRLTFMLSSNSTSGDNSNRIIILVRSVGGAVSNVTRAPLGLERLDESHIVSTSNLIMSAVLRHYRTQA
eukprot:Pgem_evm1s14612